MKFNLKAKLLVVLVAGLFQSHAIAKEQCNALSSGANYAVENQVNLFCFDSDIEVITSGYYDAQLEIEKNKLSLTTYGQGVLFNLLITLKSGETHNATFVTMKSPPIKRIITANKDDGSLEIVAVGDDVGTDEIQDVYSCPDNSHWSKWNSPSSSNPGQCICNENYMAKPDKNGMFSCIKATEE